GFGANVFVPTMDVTSFINQNAQVQTRGQFRLSFEGGYKYQGKLMFQYYNTDLENDTSPSLIFDGAQASVRNILHIFSLTYWTGYYGILGEGKHYKGHLYHMQPGFDYNGYLPIMGTGLVLSGEYYDLLNAQLFVYQRYGSSNIDSFDLVFGYNKNNVNFKLFSGMSGSAYRLGGQLIFQGTDVELYCTIGVPSIRPGSQFDFNDFYFLLEEWFKMKNWNLILSVFTRPEVHYNYIQRDYVATNEQNDIDFNFDLNYAPEASYVSGGTELNILTSSYEDLGIYLSPYISIYTSGLLWKIKLNFNFVSQTRDFITAYLNISASF
ncbi:MAG: hypothetical protein ACOC7U_01280, partial [Spirochaetota bacterium]